MLDLLSTIRRKGLSLRTQSHFHFFLFLLSLGLTSTFLTSHSSAQTLNTTPSLNDQTNPVASSTPSQQVETPPKDNSSSGESKEPPPADGPLFIPTEKIEPWKAQIMPAPGTTGYSVIGMSFPQFYLPVKMVFQNNKMRPLVEIYVDFERAGWELTIDGVTPLLKTPFPYRYKLMAYLNGSVNEITFVANGPDNKQQKAKYFVVAPDAQDFEIVTPWDTMKFYLGGTYLTYRQTKMNDFYSWNALAGLAYRSPEARGKWGIAADVNLTAFRLASNQNNYGPQLVQGLGDLVYSVPWKISARDHWQALGGVSYMSVIKNGAPFGFVDLITPTIGFRVRRIIDTDSDWVLEGRYSFLGKGINFQENGWNLSLSKGWILPNLHRADLGVKIVDYQYFPAPSQSIHVQTISYTFGYSF